MAPRYILRNANCEYAPDSPASSVTRITPRRGDCRGSGVLGPNLWSACLHGDGLQVSRSVSEEIPLYFIAKRRAPGTMSKVTRQRVATWLTAGWLNAFACSRISTQSRCSRENGSPKFPIFAWERSPPRLRGVRPSGTGEVRARRQSRTQGWFGLRGPE